MTPNLLEKNILNLLLESPKPKDAAEISKSLHGANWLTNHHDTGQAVSLLRLQGLVQKDERGKFEITEKGMETILAE